jgi:hypothetical protein
MKVYFSLFFLWCVVWFFCSIILLLLSFFSLRLLVNVYACGVGCVVCLFIFFFFRLKGILFHGLVDLVGLLHILCSMFRRVFCLPLCVGVCDIRGIVIESFCVFVF